MRAVVLKRDTVTDAAILELDGDVAGQPLPITEELVRKSPWEAFGFPGVQTRPDPPFADTFTAQFAAQRRADNSRRPADNPVEIVMDTSRYWPSSSVTLRTGKWSM